jgi:hypothetical protein
LDVNPEPVVVRHVKRVGLIMLGFLLGYGWALASMLMGTKGIGMGMKKPIRATVD